MRRLAILLPLALVLAGCGGHKMSAAQTAAFLQKQTSPGIHIHCRKGTGGWDYDCTYSGRGITGSRLSNTIGVNVNASRVTSQTG